MTSYNYCAKRIRQQLGLSIFIATFAVLPHTATSQTVGIRTIASADQFIGDVSNRSNPDTNHSTKRIRNNESSNYSIQVNGKFVKLGDIWEISDSQMSNISAFHAPSMGHTGKISFNSLLKIAQKYNVQIPKHLQNADLIVHRVTHKLDLKDLRSKIDQKLTALLPPTNNGQELELIYSIADKYLSFFSENHNFDLQIQHLGRRSNRFQALISNDNCATACQQFALKGSFQTISQLPVLNGLINKGTRINKSDIKFIKIPEKRIAVNAIRNIDEMIGHVAKRRLQPNQIVVQSDIKQFPLVKTNDRVTVEFSSGPLTLALQGIALEEGSLNQLVRVRNERSLRVLYAKVIASGKLTVGGNNE